MLLESDVLSVTSAKQYKLDRIRNGYAPRVLDLFSGCGGLSLGFHAAGFKIAGALELDPVAALSHAINFHGTSSLQTESHGAARDITKTDPVDLLTDLHLGEHVNTSIDVIIGGPPCQAFARVGRAKLREVAAHPEAFKQDARGNLYLRYLEYVRQFQPLALLVENVPDVINYGGHNIPLEMCEILTGMGYQCQYTLLNASHYGVPQMRERMFLLAYTEELKHNVEFPAPTHWVELPKGYEGSRRVALKSIYDNFLEAPFFTPLQKPSLDLPPAITTEEALGDLPKITIHLEGKLRRGTRRFDEILPYPDTNMIPPYADLMRNWLGFENHQGIKDHVIRSLPRDYPIFQRMNAGDQYPQAYQHALALFREKLTELTRNKKQILPSTPEYESLRSQMVPPYDASKFPNKWRKMEADKPARTLMAHLGKDGYSHIHYDSSQARTISVREAARLQSFPDGFIFSGSMNSAFRQIGNAVPPLLACSIASKVMAALVGE